MRRWLPLGVLAAGAVTLAAACSQESPWREGESHGRWRVVFTGYGDVAGSGDNVTLSPAVAGTREVTHGALVVSGTAPADLAVSARVLTARQLRPERPNPWEVGWVLWRFSDPDHFYAVALKPNGWEVSKQDPDYPGSQRFLASGSSPTFPVGTEHTVEIVHVGDTTAVRANGQPLATVQDTEQPYAGGGVGLYTEDARVHFSVRAIEAASALPGWAAPVRQGATAPTTQRAAFRHGWRPLPFAAPVGERPPSSPSPRAPWTPSTPPPSSTASAPWREGDTT